MLRETEIFQECQMLPQGSKNSLLRLGRINITDSCWDMHDEADAEFSMNTNKRYRHHRLHRLPKTLAFCALIPFVMTQPTNDIICFGPRPTSSISLVFCWSMWDFYLKIDCYIHPIYGLIFYAKICPTAWNLPKLSIEACPALFEFA